jgi:phosphate transport system permease protein
LAEYARPGRLLELIRTSTETLASLPSIVAGLFGLLVFVNLTGWGYSLMAGALVLTLLNLPVMVRVTEDSLRAVPTSLREASLALGATKWQTIWHVLLPVALPGIVTGVIITAGRALGEAAALLYTAGQSIGALDFSNWDITSPRSPLNPFRPGETLAVHVWKVNTEGKIPDIRRVADGTAATLVLVVLLFNVAVRWFTHRLRRRLQGA